MRQILLILAIMGLLLSCNNNDTIRVSKDSADVDQPNTAIEKKSERQLLIDELNRLQSTFASKDK